MIYDSEHPSNAGGALRRHLEAAMLSGDRDGAKALLKAADVRRAAAWKDELLSGLTAGCLGGQIPFSQLTAAAQVACLFYDDQATPVACCGAVAGNTSATGRCFMLMLLRAWGVPAIDLGVDVPESAFLSAVTGRGARFVVCAVFSQADFARVQRLDQLARTLGVRDRLHLLVSGAQMEHGIGDPSDLHDHRAAAVAEWVVRKWKA